VKVGCLGWFGELGKKAGLALLFLGVAVALSASADDPPSMARGVDEHYNHLKTLKADFTETYQGAGVDRTESGTLWLKKPGKMRWEYRSPKEKLFVSDGQAAWFYVPADRQVRKTDVRKLEDLRSPLAFLLGKTKLEKELQGLSFAPDQHAVAAGDLVLRGVPKGLENRVTQVILEITPGKQIRRLAIDEVDGSTTTYEFQNIEEDGPVPDGQFRFTPPPGVETVTGDLGP
jgi:outer membrane lipoprotein carrier protein